jgi:hypothetical protein
MRECHGYGDFGIRMKFKLRYHPATHSKPLDAKIRAGLQPEGPYQPPLTGEIRKTVKP